MIRVTDHAVVRYLERIVGIDIDSVRREIAESLSSPFAERLIEFSDGADCRIKAGDAVYCLRGQSVTTCVSRRCKPKRGNSKG
ncbi:MAG: hypothetical protein OXQ89_06085 [Rhodospirillaceae bacterium]|nr:hypothetical protein [Rhodospirillaceae bacterium]